MTAPVYLDACMIIDLVEGQPEQQERLAAALKGRLVIATELVRLESRIGALRQGQVGHLETPPSFPRSAWECLLGRSASRVRVMTRRIGLDPCPWTRSVQDCIPTRSLGTRERTI